LRDSAIPDSLEAENRFLRERIDELVREKRILELQLARQASHDELTGLLNRRAFDSHLEYALDAARELGQTHALCYLDLDQFKLLNETFGHRAGDELLVQVAERLQEVMRDTDVIARLGGDSLGVLLFRCDLEEAERRAQAFHRTVQSLRFTWRERAIQIGASLGVVPITAQVGSVTQLLSAADHACSLAKEKGRNRIQIYQEDDDAVVQRHGEVSWAVRIRQTLEDDRFRLFAQSIQAISPRATQGVHFEVLLRLIEEDGHVHMPNDFLRAAERYGLMRSIDRWVIRRCLGTLAAQPPPFLDLLSTCAINLSPMSLGDETFLDFLEDEIGTSGVAPAKLCFEITETAAIENLTHTRKLLQRLSARGIRFALDDFGTGMASYGYLRDLPVHYLKIDARFIKDVVTDPLDRAMVESIHQVSDVMGIQTIAEGVPSQATIEQLRSLGIDYAQGNWISPPRPLTEG